MEISSLFVLLLGMGTVFFGLVCLIFLTKIMSFFIRKTEKPIAAKPVSAAPVAAAAVPAGSISFGDRKLLDAIIAAAIATYDGTELQGLRIHSVKQLGNGGDRQQFVAAVSAAVATTMGTDVQGLRVHSIKKI